LTGLKLPVSTLVGMAGILSGLFHALDCYIPIAEITWYNLIPLMIVAFIFSKRFEKHRMDVKNLAKKVMRLPAQRY
jgi:CIC family chloride channel protein